MKSIIKKSIIVLGLVGLAFGGYVLYNDQTPKQWHVYSSKDHRFDVHFPKEPTEKQEQLTIANTKIQFEEMSTLDKDIHYAVSYVDFPSHWKLLGTKKLLNKSFQTFIENQNGVEKILKQEIGSHNGKTALLYQFKQDGKEIAGKFIISGNTLYRVAVTYPLAASEKVDTQTFFDSFKIKR